MNSKTLNIILGIVVVGLVGWLVYSQGWSNKPINNTTNNSQIANNVQTPFGWEIYNNPGLGFSIVLPKKVIGIVSEKWVDVKITEDSKNNTAYFRPSDIDPSLARWITVRSVKNDEELEAFIKEKFGSACKIGSIKYPGGFENSDGIYEVTVKTPGDNLGANADCPMNFAYKILYVPKQHKVAAMYMGQDCLFSGNFENPYMPCYDGMIFDSFYFNK